MVRHGSLEKLTDGLLYGIRHRGWDAAGIATFTCDDWRNPRVEKSQGDAEKLIRFRTDLPRNPRAILIHTRFATQGSEYFDRNNHPVQYGSVWTIHNGVIWNDYSLFQKLGLKPKAEVDTEVISAALHYHGDKYKEALESLLGSLAIASCFTNVEDRVLLARGSDSPLSVHETENLIVWASTHEAILSAWSYGMGTPPSYKKINRVAEGAILSLFPDHIRRENFKPAKWESSKETTTWKTYTPTPKALTTGREYNAPTTGKTLLRCSACEEFVPWDEMVSGVNGGMICSDCGLYGESYSFNKPQCEFCGTNRNLTDEHGMKVCDECMTMLMHGNV